MTDQRTPLTYDQAAAMLPHRDTIHTFMDSGIAVLGADWPREAILDLLRAGNPELAGTQATTLGHGIAAFTEDYTVYIETEQVEER